MKQAEMEFAFPLQHIVIFVSNDRFIFASSDWYSVTVRINAVS